MSDCVKRFGIAHTVNPACFTLRVRKIGRRSTLASSRFAMLLMEDHWNLLRIATIQETDDRNPGSLYSHPGFCVSAGFVWRSI